MKRPKNFETIDGIDFELMGHSFCIDLDHLQNKKESSWVWVMPTGSILGDYVVLFELKWEHDCYSMKKCVLGEGTTGNYIFQDNWISAKWIKTKDDFMEYIKRLITSEIKVGTFQN
jgi:hypothetical protein